MPQRSLHLRLLHLLGEDFADRADVAVGFGERRAFRRDVAVVEGEERHAEQAEHLEGDVGLHPRQPSIGSSVCIHGRMKVSPPNGSVPGQRERVPVADGEAQVVLHALAEHLLVGVVPAKGEPARPLALVPDRLFPGRRNERSLRHRLLDGGIEVGGRPRRRRRRLRSSAGIGSMVSRIAGVRADRERIGAFGRDQAETRGAEGRAEIAFRPARRSAGRARWR